MHLFDRISSGMQSALLVASSGFLLITTISLVIQVFMRYFIKHATVWSEDLAIFSFVWCIMLAVPVAVARREHIGVDYVLSKLRGIPKRILDTFINLAIIVTLGTLGYFSSTLLPFAERQKLTGVSLAVGFDVPLSWMYAAVPVGCFLSVFFAALLILRYREEDLPTADPVISPEIEVEEEDL